MNTARLKIPPFPARSELSQRTATEAARPCALLRQAPFSTISLTVTGARALRTAVRWGVLFDLLGGIMGMVIMAVLANLAASGVMSLVNLTPLSATVVHPQPPAQRLAQKCLKPDITNTPSRGLPSMDVAPTGGSICNTKRHCPFPLGA